MNESTTVSPRSAAKPNGRPVWSTNAVAGTASPLSMIGTALGGPAAGTRAVDRPARVRTSTRSSVPGRRRVVDDARDLVARLEPPPRQRRRDRVPHRHRGHRRARVLPHDDLALRRKHRHDHAMDLLVCSSRPLRHEQRAHQRERHQARFPSVHLTDGLRPRGRRFRAGPARPRNAKRATRCGAASMSGGAWPHGPGRAPNAASCLRGFFGRLSVAIEPLVVALFFSLLPLGLLLRRQETAHLLAPIFGLGALMFLAYAIALMVPCTRALLDTFGRIYSVDGYVRYRDATQAVRGPVLLCRRPRRGSLRPRRVAARHAAARARSPRAVARPCRVLPLRRHLAHRRTLDRRAARAPAAARHRRLAGVRRPRAHARSLSGASVAGRGPSRGSARCGRTRPRSRRRRPA